MRVSHSWSRAARFVALRDSSRSDAAPAGPSDRPKGGPVCAVTPVTTTTRRPSACASARLARLSGGWDGAADPFIGRVIHGRYRIEAVLGHGTAGRVYQAVQEPMERPVAIKVLRRDQGDGSVLESRFLREAALAGSLQHPNIVTVHDFGRTDDGICFCVMELLQGQTLRELMQGGPIPLSRALAIFEQIGRALRAVHAAGLVHRDVKPANILLIEAPDGSEHVKLLDFGLVKHEDDRLTDNGTMMGTPRYMPPEQARGLDVDHRADLYSVGVMLYEALTGVPPYVAQTAMGMALAHVRDPYPPMARRAPSVPVPKVVEDVARRCMHKHPRRRYKNADQLVSDLSTLRLELGAWGDLPGRSSRFSPTIPSVAPLPRWATSAWGRVQHHPVAKGVAMGIPAGLTLVVSFAITVHAIVAPMMAEPPLEPVALEAPVTEAPPPTTMAAVETAEPDLDTLLDLGSAGEIEVHPNEEIVILHAGGSGQIGEPAPKVSGNRQGASPEPLGALDPSLVGGRWLATSGTSMLQFDLYILSRERVDGAVRGRNGEAESRLRGSWKVDGSRIQLTLVELEGQERVWTGRVAPDGSGTLIGGGGAWKLRRP